MKIYIAIKQYEDYDNSVEECIGVFDTKEGAKKCLEVYRKQLGDSLTDYYNFIIEETVLNKGKECT